MRRVTRASRTPLLAGPGDAVTRILVDTASGAAGLSMGWMRIPPGGSTDTHVREVEEAIYIVRGVSRIVFGEEAETLEAGDAIFIAPGTEHRHENAGEEDMEHLWFFAPQGPEQKLAELERSPEGEE
jgi:quercetin dioxygenase-like cupin family protein